jgi:hypothetical protein
MRRVYGRTLDDWSLSAFLVGMNLKPLPCPFCGNEDVGRLDGPDEVRPFHVRCTRASCPAAHTTGFSDPELALSEWNRRVQMPPANPESIGAIYGFTKKSLIRGELVRMTLDRTGVLSSDALAFSPNDPPLMWKPREC